MDNNIILLNPIEFWQKHREQTQLVVREELDKRPIHTQLEEVLDIVDVCKIFKRSKQTIYNWMDAGKIQGYYLKGGELEKATDEEKKKDRESLYFKRSEIMASLEKRK